MAYTVTVVKKSVFGNERVSLLDVTADAQSGVVDSGHSIVDAFTVAPVSMNTFSLVKMRPNINGASAASNGKIMVSGCTSGDRFMIVVYGR